MDGKIVNLKSKMEIYKAMTRRQLPICPVPMYPGVSGKWSSLLMMALAEKPYRFGELRVLCPIFKRMLTRRCLTCSATLCASEKCSGPSRRASNTA